MACLCMPVQDANRLYLVLEFCAGGDLGHYLRRYRQVSEATARYFLQQVAEGLKELRRHNVIHVRHTCAVAARWSPSALVAAACTACGCGCWSYCACCALMNLLLHCTGRHSMVACSGTRQQLTCQTNTTPLWHC
jgi:hypothetical protein